MSSVCQYPFVNVFKQFGVGQWKRCCKEGDVTPVMDRDIKATVYRISGTVISSNYIQFPKATSQSLGLTGRFIYLLFRPLSGRYFSIHLELATTSGLTVRLSMSNLFKEFKSTSSWLQFPFSHLSPEETDTREKRPQREVGRQGGQGEGRGIKKVMFGQQNRLKPAAKTSRWTILVLDIRSILSQHLNTEFAYVKNIQLCANQLVKGVFTSHTEYNPLISASSELEQSHGIQPLPREMRFPLGKTEMFTELYDYVRFPSVTERLGRIEQCVELESGRVGGRYVKSVVNVSGVSREAGEVVRGTRKEGTKSMKFSRSKEVKNGVDSEGGSEVSGVHVYAERGAEINLVHNEDSHEEDNASQNEMVTIETSNPPPVVSMDYSRKETLKSLQPDPIMKLNKVIGFGGHTTSHVLFPCQGCVVYPCHNLVIIHHLVSNTQRFLIGHTAKVSCLTMNGDGCMLASGQTGSYASVRVWDFESGHCLALFQNHSHSLSSLSFSDPGSVLCGVGKDRHNKTHIILWNTTSLMSGLIKGPTTTGEVIILSQAHTDINITTMKIAHFDEKRMVSCGRENVRLWRVKGGTLRSCPITLDSRYHHMHFTDVAFQPGYPNGSDIYNRNVYACTKSGHVFEIHYSSVSLGRVWHLLPGNDSVEKEGCVAITALCLHEAFAVTGSEDGVLRVWPTDFSSVFLEGEHEACVSAVGISEDGMKILAATASGNIGILDAGTRSYATLIRSHTQSINSACLDSRGLHLITCSTDNTIRVWDTTSGEQVFDFRSTSDTPQCVSHHPVQQQVFACGFSSGAVRVFHKQTTTLIAEHRQHPGGVRSILFSPSAGHRLYTSCSAGSLAMFDADQQTCPLLRLLGNMVARGDNLGQQSLALSEDGSRLACIGPLACNVTVLDALTLNEVLRIDITPMVSQSNPVSSAHLVMFSPTAVDQLIVVTSSGDRSRGGLLKFSASNGQLLSEVSHIHRGLCTAISLTSGGRHIITAGDNSIKIWDYSMALDLNFQVFIGHSECISQLLVSSDGRRVISTAGAIFFWDFLSSPPPASPSPPSPSLPSHHTSMFSVSPRVGPPAPTNYEPFKNHIFTPQPIAPPKKDKKKSVQIKTLENLTTSRTECDHSHYTHGHVGEMDGERRREGGGRRIVRGEDCSGSDGEEFEEEEEEYDDGSSDECVVETEEGDVVIEHLSNDEVHIEVNSNSVQSTASELSHDQELQRSIPVVEKHYKPHPPRTSLATHLYVAPGNQAGIERRAVLGMSGRGRGNIVWQASTGLFAYSSGCIIVIENLSNSHQTHLTGHSEEVSTLAAQGDGKVLASSSHAHNSTPCEIRIWKLSSKKCSKVLTLHAHAVTSMAFSRDDRFLISLGDYWDNSLAVWSAYDYSMVAATTITGPAHQLAWDPYTAYEFVSVGAEMMVCFWIMEEGTRTHELKVHEAVIPSDLVQGRKKCEVDFTSVCYGPTNKLFIGSSIGVVSMWDTSQNTCIMFWKTGTCEIGAVWYSSGMLAVGDVSGRLGVWGVGGEGGGEGPPTVSLQSELELDGGIFSLSFDTNMKLGVAGTSSGCVWYINLPEETKVKLVCGHMDEVVGVALSSDGLLLATCCRDGCVGVWNMENLEQKVVFLAPKKECLCIAFAPLPLKPHLLVSPPTNEEGFPPQSPHHSYVLAAGYSDGSVRLFNNTETDDEVSGVWSERKMTPHGSPVTNITFSMDESVVLSGSSDGVLVVSSVSSGLVIRVMQDHRGAPITDLHVAKIPVKLPLVGLEGVWLWVCASGDRRVSVWNTDWTQDVCHLVDWLSFPGPACAPDGTRLHKGKKCQYDLLPPSLARFSPSDSDTILYTGYGLEMCIQFYSISQKTVLKKYAITHWATCMDISPQGHLIALGCSERVLKLMDYSEGSFQDFSGHHDSVKCVAFSITGRSVISTSDSITHVWRRLHCY